MSTVALLEKLILDLMTRNRFDVLDLCLVAVEKRFSFSLRIT